VNRLILYIFLLIPGFLNAQALLHDSLELADVRSLEEDFKQDYQDEDFVYEEDSELYQQTVWESLKAWLKDFFYRWFNFETSDGAALFVEVLLKAIYIIIIIVVIYFVVKAFLKKEGHLFIDKSNKKLNISADVSDESLLKSNLDELIKEAIKKKEYRLATRFYYIKTLQQLDLNQLIKWEQEQTNIDILRQIKQEEIKRQFSYISYLYNYSWYGKFELSEQDFKSVQQSFADLNQRIKA
jgi:spore coat protein CotF